MSAFFICCYFRFEKAAKLSLLLASLFFYAYWDIRFLPLLCGSIALNYILGNLIHSIHENNKRFWVLFGGVSVNLGALFYCKYCNFFIQTTNIAFEWEVQLIELILPLGISFFTFTQIAYLVDLYNKKSEPGNFLSYGLFVTVFPHLIAGPILHHKEMISQFNDSKNFRWIPSNFAEGIFLFVLGLSKKLLVADYLIGCVSCVFDKTDGTLPFIQAWIGALSYTTQLYFDFSGYSDMAVGLGKMFNLDLPINFNSPYQAVSIIDFWRRWHISLSFFLRNYLYIPLGGNRGGEWRKMRNLVITMIIGGIWHGAGWTYILWGFLHGIFLAINHQWAKFKISLPNFFARSLTMLCIIIGWVVFRSPNIQVAKNILSGMIGLNGFSLPEKYAIKFSWLAQFGVQFLDLTNAHFPLWDIVFLFIAMCIALFFPNSAFLKEKFYNHPLKSGALTAFLFISCCLHLSNLTEFLYYQF